MGIIAGGFTLNGSLIAPIDVMRFLFAYMVIVIAPGYAVVTLARPRSPSIERIAFAVPCAYALVALVGLATALLHLPFGLPAYGVLALPITLAGGYATWRTHAGRTDNGIGRWWIAPAGVALAQVIAIWLAFGGDTVPTGFDVLSHVQWTNLIARSHIYPIALLSAFGDANGGFYPPVFHALTALVLGLAPMPTYRADFFNVVAATIPLPLALFSYVRVATGQARLGAFAALAALAFEPLPFFVLALGLYPFTVSLLCVPMLTIALRDGLGEGNLPSVALAALLGIGLFYTHPTEFVTVGILTLAIVPSLLHGARSWARACGYAVVVAIAWLVAAAPALAAVRRTMVFGAQAEIHTTHDFMPSAHVHLQTVLNSYVPWLYGRNVSYLLLVAIIIGIVACIVRRRWIGLVVVQAIAFFVFIDSNSYDVLQRIYDLSFPWALLERLTATHYWITLPLAAIGIDAAVRFMRPLTRKKHALFIALLAAPFALLGLLLPLDVSAGRAAAYTHARKVVAQPDFGALTWLARHAPTGSVVVNDVDVHHMATFDAPIDAGRWMPVLGGPQPLFWRSASGPGSLNDRLYVLGHIADDPLPPRVVRFVKQHDVRYVFYGAGVRPGARRHLNLAHLLADPQLHLVYTSEPTCRPGAAHLPPSCPSTGSYIFALTP